MKQKNNFTKHLEEKRNKRLELEKQEAKAKKLKDKEYAELVRSVDIALDNMFDD